MKTGIFTHASSLAHDTGYGHPERPERFLSAQRALKLIPELDWREAPAASREQILRVHTPELYDGLSVFGVGAWDADTVLSEQSFTAALHAAGAVCAAVDAVCIGELRNAFCLVRPPGHHAEPAQAMGFCLFNNVAIGARHARAVHGKQRVAVLDFDVHHGNGTQAAAWDDTEFFFASSHQWPFYPGSGAAGERGAHGNIHNVPLAAGCGSAVFRAAWAEQILPALAAFRPDFTLISAGFDAHVVDPLGGLDLTSADFAWLTREIVRITGPNLVSTLEGGYNLAALADSCVAHVRALLEMP
jgi:acetoin utilization deacetylase AcuC-like enzyme